ncbi:MAG: hypothetical protein JWR26_3498 [Pedosphaera sp.]|nr:hypothetical protein [Pedosphaera sp.]
MNQKNTLHASGVLPSRNGDQTQTSILNRFNGRRTVLSLLAVLFAMIVSATTANAWHLDGTVLCPSGTPYANVVINVTGSSNCGGPTNLSVTTDANGHYFLTLPECDGCYTATIDATTLPLGATVISPGASSNFCLVGATSQIAATINWVVDSTLCGTPTNCLPVTSCITSEFNGTSIPQGDFIWFNSVFKVSGRNSKSATILFDSSTVSFTVNGTPITLTVPAAVIKFDSSATVATTIFNSGMNAWVTVVPANYSGNVFLSGLAYQLPVNFPGGIKHVTWCGDFSSDTSGLSFNWQWAAAVYTSFNANLTGVNVKPVDDNKISMFLNSDHAGTPENFKTSVVGGARGGGGSNFTGSYSGTAGAGLCP